MKQLDYTNYLQNIYFNAFSFMVLDEVHYELEPTSEYQSE